MAVATGGTRALCLEILDRLQIREWFDAIVCAEDVSSCKPEPEIFLLSANLLKVPPGSCLVYEDTDAGIQAARSAGMEVVDVRTLR